jgi:hypothetical protein
MLLLLLLTCGLFLWFGELDDTCSRLPAAMAEGATEPAMVGSQMVEVSCGNWLARMPSEMQVVAMADAVAAVVLLFAGIADLQDWSRRKSGL